MLQLRKSQDRGHSNHGWLDSWHTFSFSEYHDPQFMGFRSLRVINEDRVDPGRGFPTHAHRNMEIVSYVLAGSLQHKDSIGTGSLILPGEVQRMSAGTGISHSEFNGSSDEPVHFLQIWLIPAQAGLAPGYEQKAFPADERNAQFKLVASPQGDGGSVTVHSDARIYSGVFDNGADGTLSISPGRHAWVQVARGKALVNGLELSAGDGLALSEEPVVSVRGLERAELLVFDLG